MGLENATNINSLNENNPLGTDPRSQGDDHIRMIKSVLKSDVFAASLANGSTDKATPVDADLLLIADSAASYGRKKLTWANLKAAIKSYYDSVAATLTNKTISGANNTLSNIGIGSITMNTGKLLGRTTAGSGAVEEIAAGPGLSLSNGTLTCTVTGGVTTFNSRSGAVTLAASDITSIDGAGSGIDADLLDGLHASAFAPATGGNYVSKDIGYNAVGSFILGIGASIRSSLVGLTGTAGSYNNVVISGYMFNVNASVSGTWRCVGQVSFSNEFASFVICLFQRIS